MLDVLNLVSPATSLATGEAIATLSSAPLAPVSRAEKRSAVDRELRADPGRNDSQIARLCDVDHKTVAARRREIQIPNDGNFAPSVSNRHETSQSDAALPVNGEDNEGVNLKLTPPLTAREHWLLKTFPPEVRNSPAFQQALAKVDTGAAEDAAREKAGLNDNDFNWSSEEDSIVLKEQMATAVYFNQLGELVIRQQARWDQEEDSMVYVAECFQREFLNKLCDAMEIPSYPPKPGK